MSVFSSQAPVLRSPLGKCFNRRPCLSTSATSASASPASRSSGHRLWADISDGEDEDLSDWGSERMLPSSMLSATATPESGTPRAVPTEGEDFEEAAMSSLNVYAVEFVPTQSMTCPLVGICDVIVEGNEAEDSAGSAELRFTTPHSLQAVQFDRLPRSQEAAQASTKKFWRTSKAATLVVQQRAAQGVLVETLSESQIARRVRNIEVCKDSKEYAFHVEQVKLLGPGAEPLTPDPRDSAISKRSWVRAVQSWREELCRRYLSETDPSSLESRPEAASVASTEAEEAQGSEAGDSTTDDSSSAHWSCR